MSSFKSAEAKAPWRNERCDPHITCNHCRTMFTPYNGWYAPTLDEVVCPNCGEKRILYYGDNAEVAKTLLSGMGKNTEVLQKLTELESQIDALKDMVKTNLDDARNIMTKALVGALNEQINRHVSEYHSFGNAGKKPKGDTDGKQKN